MVVVKNEQLQQVALNENSKVSYYSLNNTFPAFYISIAPRICYVYKCIKYPWRSKWNSRFQVMSCIHFSDRLRMSTSIYEVFQWDVTPPSSPTSQKPLNPFCNMGESPRKFFRTKFVQVQLTTNSLVFSSSKICAVWENVFVLFFVHFYTEWILKSMLWMLLIPTDSIIALSIVWFWNFS